MFGVFLFCLLVGGIGGFLFFYNIGNWLSRADQPCRVDVIICLSTDYRVKKAVDLLQQGYSLRLICTTTATRQKALEYGVDPAFALVAAKDARTTFQEALYVKPLLREHNFRSAMVISDPYHLARIRWTFNRVCHDLPVTFSFIGTDWPGATDKWWKNRRDRQFVLSEIPKMIYYRLYHGLLGIVEDPDETGKLKGWYSRMLWKMDRRIERWGE